MPKRSAGLLVSRRVEGEPKVLLVHPGGPFWANKGEYEPDEDPLEVAFREFREELGVDPPEASEPTFLGEVRQPGGKLVSAWALPGDLDVGTVRSNTFTMEWPPRSGRIGEFPEVDRAGWFDLETARRKLLPGQLGLLDRFSELLNAGSVE